MPAFREAVLKLAEISGGHRVRKDPKDERIAFTPEDLCSFVAASLELHKELYHAAKRDCTVTRIHPGFVSGWWDRYCEDLRRSESGAPKATTGVSKKY